MEKIDVSGLPEPYIQAVQAVVDAFRRQLSAQREEKPEEPTKPPIELPHCPLGVIGNLTRDEIYDDRV